MQRKGAIVKLGDFEKVSQLKAELERYAALHDAATQGFLHLTANHEGTQFDFGEVLTGDETRGTLANLISIKAGVTKGKLRELGVDPDA